MKRKLLCIMISIMLLSGCATYKFGAGAAPYNNGYVVSRNGYTIVEYTVDKEGSVPADLKLAKERFKKRRGLVEYYYKKMGYIENQFKMIFWNPAVMAVSLITGPFRLPAIAIADYKYEHNPAYRERVKKLEEEKEAREESRIKQLKDELNSRLQKDSNT